jgi:ADP-ribose pyrophosphatase YjhB (NUDIX family)
MMEAGTNQEKSKEGMDSNMEGDDGCTTPEEPETFNRVKAPPICVDLSLKQESMSTETLLQWIFPENMAFPLGSISKDNNTPMAPAAIFGSSSPTSESQQSILQNTTHIPVSVISVSSNNSYADSNTLSSDEMPELKSNNYAIATPRTIISRPSLNRVASELLNAKVLMRKTSRQGRSTQRWASTSGVTMDSPIYMNSLARAHSPNADGILLSAAQEPMLRLVTGCVPILRSGKILFISASRKPAWILPKGGWEQDESMEESAVRECFEEAGCIGTLGPALTPVQYEARKAKKRRVESELLLEQQAKSIAEAWLDPSKLRSHDINSSKSNSSMDPDNMVGPKTNGNLDEHASLSHAEDAINNTASITTEAVSRIRQPSQNVRSSGHQTDTESVSVGSGISTTYTHAQMTLFPLYVQKIKDEWPERGRFRKAVDINEAIKMMEGRPEFHAVLLEVRARGLHLVPNI